MTRAGRAELADAVFWTALGAAVLVAAWRMDRLTSLGINPLSAPGVVPGLLGALMMLFGAALGLRAMRAREASHAAVAGTGRAARTACALALCIGYAAGLLGRGLPFWLTSAAFLFVAIFVFRILDGDAGPRWRTAVESAAIALAAAGAIALVFQQLFLLRLP